MFCRYFLAVCVLALFIGNASVKAQEEAQARASIPKPAVKAGVAILRKTFVGAVAGCLIEAAEHCQSQLKHPTQLIKCGGDYLKENKGRCLI